MIGHSLGPYTIEQELGSGGMGTVFRASVSDPAAADGATRVAVKVVHRHLLGTEGFLRRFEREASVGRRVRHENVVRTLDAGAADFRGREVRYLVMEYVEGRTLRSLLDEMGTVPESLLREIAAQTAAGLAAIHAAGIVHRDIKPDNVLLTHDQRVRIMDLGVARPQEASVAITLEGQFAGSLLYAAPEQFRGEAPGPAADLYSFGVTLYELATGRNPFHAAEVGAVISAHLEFVPPRVTDANPDASPFLAELVATLLAKDASARIPTAAALGEILAEGERSAWWTDRERDVLRSRSSVPRVPVSRDTGFYGRDAEAAALREAWADARAGRGRVVLLEGEPGIGKSRLVDAFLAEFAAAGGPEPHVLYGSWPPSGGAGGLSDAILGKFGAAGFEDQVAPYMSLPPARIAGFAALLRNEAPGPGGVPVSPEALHALFCRLMQGLAAERPVLWVADDLHFATADSRRVVQSMARAVEGHPVLLLATTRPAMLPDDEVAQLGRLPGFRRVALGRLSPRQVIQLLGDALRSESLAERLGGRIAFKSDGVPYFVLEIVRSLKEGRLVVQQADGSFVATAVIEDVSTPATVRDLVTGRLADLRPDERALLEVGAVEGFQFDPDLARRVLEIPRLTALRTLAEIERRTGVVRSGAGFCRFDHHQIQEVLYASLTHDLRAEYHATLAETFALREGLADRTKATGEAARFLAWHGLRGSRPVEWIALVPGALAHLERGFRNADFVALAETALALPVPVPGLSKADVLLKAAECLARLGRRAQERTALDAADAIAAESGDAAQRCRTLCALALHAQVMSEFEQSLVHARAALEVTRAAGHVPGQITALHSIAGAHWRLGRGAEACATVDESLVLARAIGDRRLEARALQTLATLHGDLLSDPARCATLLDESVAIRRSLGEDVREAAIQNNLSWARICGGRFADAMAHLDECLAIVNETGARLGRLINLTNRGLLLAYMGDRPGARIALAEARTLCREIAERRSESYAIHRMAVVEEDEGDSAAALAGYAEALAIRRAIRYPRGIAETTLAIGRVHLAAGRRAEAAAHLAESEETARATGSVGPATLAAIHRARIDGTPAAAESAAALLAANEARLDAVQRVEARYALWLVRRDPADLAAARAHLDFLVENAPPGRRAAMTAGVPLFRAVATAGRKSVK